MEVGVGRGPKLSKQSFIYGTMILLAAGIVNRILGFIPRIALPRVIGAEAVGIYQLAYPFLIVVLTIITGGIPLAVAKLVAEAHTAGNPKRVKQIVSVSLAITVSLSLLFTFICLLSAPWITSHWLTDKRVYYTFLTMSPMFVFVAISSVYRGYFQGKLDMIPTATSQIVETVIRIVAMLLFAFLLLPYGLEYAAAGAMGGVLVGEIGGMAVLLLHKRLSNRTPRTVVSPDNDAIKPAAKPLAVRQRSHLRAILTLSIPVTASRLVGSLSYLLESIMTSQSLAIAGVATAVATAQYGALQGMVVPVLLLPGALTYALAVSLVPSLSEAAAQNDMKTIHKRLHQSLRLALVTGAPFAVIMYVLAEPLCKLLYNDTNIAVMLKMMAPIALFIYLQSPLQAALQALDKPGTALINTFIGAAVKIILIVQLATKPEFGIYGVLIAINVNIVLVTLLHGYSVARQLHFSMKLSDFFKVGFGMAGMAAVCYFIMFRQWIDLIFVRFFAACLFGLFCYLAVMVWLKLIDKFDIVRIPGLRKLWNKR